MARRYKVKNVMKDRRLFTRTATKNKKVNLTLGNKRGGGCL